MRSAKFLSGLMVCCLAVGCGDDDDQPNTPVLDAGPGPGDKPDGGDVKPPVKTDGGDVVDPDGGDVVDPDGGDVVDPDGGEADGGTDADGGADGGGEADGGADAGLMPDAECHGDIVDTEAECLQDDAYCTELASGKFCTGSLIPACPDNYVPATEPCPEEPVFWCIQYTESLECQLRELSDAECTAAGGEAVGDPGDGSVSSVGCPDQRLTLGFVVPGGIEGTLCCDVKE